MKNKWITFDLDGTLMQNPFGAWVFPELEQLYMKSVGDQRKNKQIFQELVFEHRIRMQSGRIVEAYDWDDIVGVVFAREGVAVEVDITELVKKHSMKPKIYLLEEKIIDAMLILRSSGYKLAAVTNGFEIYQKPVMDVLGLSEQFDVLITPEKVGFGKPRVEMVQALHNSENEIVAHVGDRIDHDIIFANELGVQSILVHREMPAWQQAMAPPERVASCMKWIQQKWQRETGNHEFPENGIPDLVIYSIEEINQESLRLT